jgi:hypothetical protein
MVNIVGVEMMVLISLMLVVRWKWRSQDCNLSEKSSNRRNREEVKEVENNEKVEILPSSKKSKVEAVSKKTKEIRIRRNFVVSSSHHLVAAASFSAVAVFPAKLE